MGELLLGSGSPGGVAAGSLLDPAGGLEKLLLGQAKLLVKRSKVESPARVVLEGIQGKILQELGIVVDQRALLVVDAGILEHCVHIEDELVQRPVHLGPDLPPDVVEGEWVADDDVIVRIDAFGRFDEEDRRQLPAVVRNVPDEAVVYLGDKPLEVSPLLVRGEW